MSGEIVLVTGGARSGKSAFAERYAARRGEKIAYIATAQIYDEEMRFRVQLHQARRPAHWTTYEAPYDAERAIAQAGASHEAILFDCLTLYTTNLLCSDRLPAEEAARYEAVRQAAERLVESAQRSGRCVVFVTNEVGMGIVPENALARAYRDLAGIVNQRVAAAADRVFLTISGLAVDIKKLAEAEV